MNGSFAAVGSTPGTQLSSAARASWAPALLLSETRLAKRAALKRLVAQRAPPYLLGDDGVPLTLTGTAGMRGLGGVEEQTQPQVSEVKSAKISACASRCPCRAGTGRTRCAPAAIRLTKSSRAANLSFPSPLASNHSRQLTNGAFLLALWTSPVPMTGFHAPSCGWFFSP